MLSVAAQADNDEGQQLCQKLGVTHLPTLQFYRDGVKLWEQKGSVGMDSDLGTGAGCAACHLLS